MLIPTLHYFFIAYYIDWDVTKHSDNGQSQNIHIHDDQNLPFYTYICIYDIYIHIYIYMYIIEAYCIHFHGIG